MEDHLLDVRKAITAYCDEHHDVSFDADAPVVRLHEPSFGPEEILACTECLLSQQVTLGKKVRAFEDAFAGKYGWSDGVMVNSGSSANLLAISALTNPDCADGLRPGDEVIVPALSWSTSVWPLIQCGLVPVIVDIDPLTLNIDPQEIERAIGPKTRGLLIIHVYGNPCDMTAIEDICRRKNLILIEDSCEAHGSSYNGRPVGDFGRVSTFSFYYSHHITTIEGGVCVTKDRELAELMRVLRAHGWVRELKEPQVFFDQYPDIDRKFLFVNLGYNLRPTEIAGAMGLVQLPKLDTFVKVRRDNAAWFLDNLSRYSEFMGFQSETKQGESSWFGFPVTLNKDAPFSKPEFTQFLYDRGIETRPIICGNIAKQPALQRQKHRVQGDLSHSTNVMRNAFSFGNHHAIEEASREYIVQQFEDYLFEFMGRS